MTIPINEDHNSRQETDFCLHPYISESHIINLLTTRDIPPQCSPMSHIVTTTGLVGQHVLHNVTISCHFTGNYTNNTKSSNYCTHHKLEHYKYNQHISNSYTAQKVCIIFNTIKQLYLFSLFFKAMALGPRLLSINHGQQCWCHCHARPPTRRRYTRVAAVWAYLELNS